MRVTEEVAAALAAGQAVVALESTLLAHGLPPGRNRKVAAEIDDLVYAAGAVPATIAVLDGQIQVGTTPADLDRICDPEADLAKLSARDLGPAIALGRDGATTIASTSVIARAAGIPVFGTGGLGGVHLPPPGETVSWDVSADLDVLASTPVVVVCSGVKSVLDIGATIEVLETRSVPVLGYRTDSFPAFYRRESAFPVPWRVDTPAAAAAVIAAHFDRELGSGLLLTNPVPPEHELAADLHNRLLTEGMELVVRDAVRGGDVTPVLLEHFHTGSAGKSLDANEALVLNNVANGNLSAFWSWVLGIGCAAVFAAVVLGGHFGRLRRGLVTKPTPIVVFKVLGVAAIALLGTWAFSLDRSQTSDRVVVGVPWVVPLVLALLVIGTYVLNRTRYGRHIYAVGGNAEAARRAGIDVSRIRASVFVVSSGMAAIGAIVYSSKTGLVSANAGGGNTLLFAVGAAVIGGTSLFGGRGKVVHAIIGGLVLQVVENGLGLLGQKAAVVNIITGAVLLLAATVDALSRRRAAAASG